MQACLRVSSYKEVGLNRGVDSPEQSGKSRVE